MLALFLRPGNRVSQDPACQPATEDDARECPKVEPTTVQRAGATDSTMEGETCEACRMISCIIANAGFLQVIYGKTRALSNIVDTANDLKKKLREKSTPEDGQGIAHLK